MTDRHVCSFKNFLPILWIAGACSTQSVTSITNIYARMTTILLYKAYLNQDGGLTMTDRLPTGNPWINRKGKNKVLINKIPQTQRTFLSRWLAKYWIEIRKYVNSNVFRYDQMLMANVRDRLLTTSSGPLNSFKHILIQKHMLQQLVNDMSFEVMILEASARNRIINIYFRLMMGTIQQ